MSAARLAKETGLRQQSLSRWLQEARSLPTMTDKPKPAVSERSVEQKALVLAEAARLDGNALTAYLEREGVKFAEYEQWRPACGVLGISARTIERWRAEPEAGDRRHGPHARPSNALSPAEEVQVVTVLTSSRYAGLSPKQLVPQLADEGLYLASESTMYRVQPRHGLARSSRRYWRKAHSPWSRCGPRQ